MLTAIEVSRATLQNIKQNLSGAFIYNALCITIAAGIRQTRPTAVEVLPEKPGEYEFTCGMNMYKGKLIV